MQSPQAGKIVGKVALSSSISGTSPEVLRRGSEIVYLPGGTSIGAMNATSLSKGIQAAFSGT